jgi:coenzyme F420-reducing hydrogenase gamma subunit
MKPKVAVFDFASCEGCELQIVNLEEDLLGLLEHVDVVSFREAMKEHSDDYDIAFIEGGLVRKSDEERLKNIREHAKILVACGMCAITGGVNAMKNSKDPVEVRKAVYGDKYEYFDTYAARPLEAVVKVDYNVYGCPMTKTEFLTVVKSLLMGKKPDIANYPVCVECKLKENVCVYDKGLVCMGPVTRAGCDANCPSFCTSCIGCRGLLDRPQEQVQKDVLQKYGLTVDEVMNQFRFFSGWREVKDAETRR